MATTSLIPCPETAEPPEPETALMAYRGGMPSIARMKENMAHQKAMRGLLIEYVRSEMDPARHFYTVDGSTKPALSQDGARNLCGLYQVRAGESQLEEQWFPDGHYHVRVTMPLYSLASGTEMARGTGSCSTKESRYAYRWVWANDVPGHVAKADLKSRKRGNSYQYRMPNEDLPDLYNTVLKLAEKRAQTAAVLRLPAAAEVFADPSKEDEDHAEEADAERTELTALIKKWLLTVAAGGKSKAFYAVFNVAMNKIAELSLEQLDTGYALIELGTAAGLDWKSPTLAADLAALQAGSAAKAQTDLYGDGGGTGGYAHQRADVSEGSPSGTRERTVSRATPAPAQAGHHTLAAAEPVPEGVDPETGELFDPEKSAALDREDNPELYE